VRLPVRVAWMDYLAVDGGSRSCAQSPVSSDDSSGVAVDVLQGVRARDSPDHHTDTL